MAGGSYIMRGFRPKIPHTQSSLNIHSSFNSSLHFHSNRQQRWTTFKFNNNRTSRQTIRRSSSPVASRHWFSRRRTATPTRRPCWRSPIWLHTATSAGNICAPRDCCRCSSTFWSHRPTNNSSRERLSSDVWSMCFIRTNCLWTKTISFWTMR